MGGVGWEGLVWKELVWLGGDIIHRLMYYSITLYTKAKTCHFKLTAVEITQAKSRTQPLSTSCLDGTPKNA